MRGIICHHTGSSAPGAWTVVRDGRPDLAGPLAHMTLERDGSVRILCNGLAWHAGTGSWPSIGANNGNATCLGIEAVYDGNDITGAQRDAYPRLCAALCRHYGIAVGNVIGHREWAPTRKVDPGRIDLPAFRSTVQALLDGHPSINGSRTGVPEMIDRTVVPGKNNGTIIIPTGSVSGIVARSWFNVRIAGGGRVQAWFQRSADSDGPAPGAGTPLDVKLKSAERHFVEVPDGTEFIEFDIDANGPGGITVECLAK